MAQPIIIALSSLGISQAEKIATRLQLQWTHGDTIKSLQKAFALRQPIIAVGACGIAIRALSPVLENKHGEAPVVCVTPDNAVVVLLGGHHGGNPLARQIAESIGGQAIISTASQIGEFLDDLPDGWRKQGEAKTLMVKSAEGQKIRLYDPHGFNILPELLVEESDRENADIIISDRISDEVEGKLNLYPPSLVVGVGCERHAPTDDVIAGIKAELQKHDLSPLSVVAVASIDIKCDEAALHGLAEHFNCGGGEGGGLRFFTADELNKYDSRLLNPSEVVMAEVGCRGVAEGAALASFAGACDFLVPKQKHGSFTCAVVRKHSGAELAGSIIGRLDIVGIGPGDSAYRTDSATVALMEADVVVGYSLYLDLCADVTGQAERLDYPLGEESERCLKALQLAAGGKKVALVCSGDAGIYALGAVVYDVLAEQDSRALNAVSVINHSGVSAFQLLAARVGAPFGDDFCLISLSDLWIDEAVIRKRIVAAVAGDFAMAFYNPQSERRRSMLPFAIEELRKHRKGDVPVVVGRKLGRAGESIKISSLSDFSHESIDMLSLVMVGNSRTRILGVRGEQKIYSPRILSRGKIEKG